MLLTKRVRIYTSEDVEEHASPGSCWVTRDGKVYDVTQFLPDHPGGDDLILKYAGKDVGEIMKDSTEHDHSDSAYNMLGDLLIGRLGADAGIVDENWVPSEHFQPDETDISTDYEKNQFLDLGKPLLSQFLYANFSKSYYLQQIHQPRHVAQSARLFGPDYLEIFTKTKWYIVPLFWLPIAAYLLCRGTVQFEQSLPPFTENPLLPLSLVTSVSATTLLKVAPLYIFGNFFFTFLEYSMHRFLFHIDYYLPDKPMFLMLHFLMHGVHHYLPMDPLRLVMPPVLFAALSYPFTQLGHFIFPTPWANCIIAGAFTYYVFYDCTHYALHHTKLPAYLREVKKYHLAHHYKNYELGFGVTSKLWDVIFNTVLPV